MLPGLRRLLCWKGLGLEITEGLEVASEGEL